jgi:hypothetical protein
MLKVHIIKARLGAHAVTYCGRGLIIEGAAPGDTVIGRERTCGTCLKAKENVSRGTKCHALVADLTSGKVMTECGLRIQKYRGNTPLATRTPSQVTCLHCRNLAKRHATMRKELQNVQAE